VSRSELVSLDVLGSDDELRAAARTRPDAANRDAEAEGRDASRAVTVRIDRAGHVSDVLISNWWRDNLMPSELQAALLEAYQAASRQAASLINPRDTARVSSATAFDLPPNEPVDQDDASWLEDLRHRLGRVQDTLERSDRLLHGSAAPIERVVSGPAGLVQLILHGRIVAQIRIDVHAAMQESPNRLAADALAAFQAIH
jgi:hypothetical protein